MEFSKQELSLVSTPRLRLTARLLSLRLLSERFRGWKAEPHLFISTETKIMEELLELFVNVEIWKKYFKIILCLVHILKNVPLLLNP